MDKFEHLRKLYANKLHANNNVVKRDNIEIKKPLIKIAPVRRQYSFVDLGGSPGKDIKQEDRYSTNHENAMRDGKKLLNGLNNTIGTAASLASLIYGGGWSAIRLLNGNKASNIGYNLSKGVLISNQADNIGDVGQFLSNPTLTNAAELTVGLTLPKLGHYGQIKRHLGEVGSQVLNVSNQIK